GGDQAALTRVYISLGRELGEQVESLRGDPSQAEALQKTLAGFEAFLTNIAQRKEGNTFSSLNWVGETFLTMGEKLDTGGSLSQQAKNYYSEAASTFQTMIEMCKANRAFAPSEEAAILLEIRLSKCERRLGKHKEALDRLTPLLQKNPKLLEGQR